MLANALVLFATILAGLVSAQNGTAGSYPYLVSPGSVDMATRQTWCNTQLQSCPNICGGGAYPNTCDPSTLTYTCTCQGGPTPNITQYQQTLPFFECQEYKSQCVARNPTDAQAQKNCNNIPCGSKKPMAPDMSSSSVGGMSSPTGSSSSSSGESGSSSGSSSSSSSTMAAQSSSPAMALTADQIYSKGFFAFGVLALIGGLGL